MDQKVLLVLITVLIACYFYQLKQQSVNFISHKKPNSDAHKNKERCDEEEIQIIDFGRLVPKGQITCPVPTGMAKEFIRDRYRPDQFVYQIPVSEIVAKYPIFGEVWHQFKGMVTYGTKPHEQSQFALQKFKKHPHLLDWQKEIMTYPDKPKYWDKETNDKPYNLEIKYNDVWKLKNGKYQHKLYNTSFPNYHWDKRIVEELDKLGLEARGNFYYQKYGFREWHTNYIHQNGWRMYFISLPNGGDGWFNMIDPNTDQVVNVKDKDEHVNIFCVDEKYMLWHSIYSDTDRFSLGFNQIKEF